MGFWKNVDEYLQYAGISRKELAAAIDVNSQTIDRAIERDSEPKFNTGLKVCNFLKLNPDELLDSPVSTESNSSDNESSKKEIKLYRKYHELIQNCEIISEPHLSAINQLAKTLAETAPDYKPTE